MKKTRSQSWIQLLIGGALIFMVVLSPLSSIPVYAMAVPVLISPINGHITTPDLADYPPLAIPEFIWTPVAGAITYRLQVSGDIAFTNTAVNITTPNTSYTPTNASDFPDGIWYWRVRVEEPAPIGEYSSNWSFYKKWATETNNPTLVAPGNGALVDFYDTPLFSWDPVMGAAFYKLQIYSSPGGWATLAYSVTTLAITHQPDAKLANGTYYWRVVPVDGGSHDGTPSEERSFNSNYNPVELALIEPENNAQPTLTPTFRWKAVRGAQFYRLLYSTDPSFSTNLTTIDTRNTSYTPTSTLPNDVNYYWRVRVHSGNSISDWTPSRTFIKRWYLKPILLTPTDNYQHQRFPVFSWKPVPGASYYKVEISLYTGFSPLYDSGNTANTFYSPSKYDGAPNTYYWRVTPYDGNGKDGKVSNTSSYVSYSDSVAPSQVYPLFYYPPDASLNPHEDRTVALPVFVWNRVYFPSGSLEQGNIFAEAYRLQVSTDPTFTSISWTVDTENTTATPTNDNPFTPLAETDYFWRVQPLDGVGGSESGEWSQIWKTRFDLSKGLSAQPALTLIRPSDGFEFAESTPLLEWFPISGVTGYEVQISQDKNFGTVIDSTSVSNPVYAPKNSLAQRSLGDVDFGIYYWRVRGIPDGVWSETRRFQIAAQSQWQFSRTLGNSANRLQIGSDPVGDTNNSDYDVINLHAAQASNYWYFGFATPVSPITNVAYALYLDIDHKVGSGGTIDPKGYTINTIPTYQPEYVIYILQNGGNFSADQVYLYRWTDTTWDTVSILSAIGGALYQESGYVELKIPNTAIGSQDTTGSYAVSLISLAANGLPKDSVPSDPSATNTGVVSRFANVTERMNLVLPPNDAGVDPSTYPSVQPFFWDWPILSPWSGAIMKAYLDEQFTSEIANYELNSNTAYFASTYHSWEKDFVGDNTYYWRIQPRYRDGGNLYNGAWSQGWRFERQGFVPKNLATSVTFATPTFSWDMVEGVESYDLQVDDDPSFGSTAININSRQNSYTSTNTLANGLYYWRVRVLRYGGVVNDWTSNESFSLNLPTPEGLTPASGSIVDRAPTMCWKPIQSVPVLAAWKYRVQVSKEPTFSSTFETIETEQSCWTPKRGYDDGDYYWRVAMIDGDGRSGNYSAYQKFTKQYPITTLVSPFSGSIISETPTFIWIPVAGAAKYILEVSQFPTFAPTYESVTTANTRFTPTKTYTSSKTYYWRVAIIDNDGKIGPFVGATILLDPNPYRIYLPTVLK